MRAVVQRVKSAEVKINGSVSGAIKNGLLVFLAVHNKDDEHLIPKLADKILKLRIFSDEQGKMNLSVRDICGSILVVSQFTLFGDTNKGNRPSFIESAKPEKAIPFYNSFVEYIKASGTEVQTGEFGAEMEVSLVNDGPVTIIIDQI